MNPPVGFIPRPATRGGPRHMGRTPLHGEEEGTTLASLASPEKTLHGVSKLALRWPLAAGSFIDVRSFPTVALAS